MAGNVIIRDETPADIETIYDITIEAFRTLEISNHTEQFVIAALRDVGALAISLVAEIDGRVVGHIAFSPITISDGSEGWFGLGPVSVLPEVQRQGIGRGLINEGLDRLRNRGAQGCCLVGHPDYYRRLGFDRIPGLIHEGVPEEVFLAMPFLDRIPQGTVHFHEAFNASA